MRGPRLTPSTYSTSTPGRNLRNSPTLPSLPSPKLSAATEVEMFMLRRCSMMALALPSRSVVTTNLLISTTSSLPAGLGSVLTNSKSRVTAAPAVTVTAARAVW